MIHHAYISLRVARPSWGGARRTLVAVATSVGILGSSRTAAAQASGLFETFGSRKELATDPILAGLALSGYRGILGLRVSGAVHTATTSPRTVTTCRGRSCRRSRQGDGGQFGYDVDAWVGDVDLVLAPVRATPLAQAMLLGFSPYLFAGVGGTGVRPANAADSSHATISFGAGLSHSLIGPLGLDAEARYRRPLQTTSSELLAGSRRAWEYRAGLSIAFGGRRAKEPAGATVVVAPIVSATPDVPRAAARAPIDARRIARLLDRAEGYIDTPYRVGGADPTTGFDAPGFVQSLYASEGITLPRSAAEMTAAGEEVPMRVGSLRPGDLLFFANDGTAIDHVAIYVGHERIIHSSASGGGVRYDTLGEGDRGRWFADHLVSARRVLSEAPAPVTRAVTPVPGDHAPRPERSKP